MTFKSPDLNAPRFRKSKLNLVNKDFFKKLREEFPMLAALSDKDIRDVIETYNRITWETALHHRDGVELPENLGMIFIGACDKKTSENTDFKTSGELNKAVEHLNLNSDSFVAKIFYTTFSTKYRFRNQNLWGFSGCRTFTRACSQEFRKNYDRYVRIDKHVKISTMFREKPEQVYQYEHKAPEDYNEFDL